MNTITKVIIPIAGLGTRMLPATKLIPKEMLTIASVPIIQYVVKEAIDAGFTEIIFVSRSAKNLVKDYFQINSKQERILKKKLTNNQFNELREISRPKAKIFNVRQNEAKGLGHAVLCAKSLISDESFAVMLPDMVLDSNYKKTNLALMKKNFKKTGESSILLGKVEKSKIQSYGIAKFKKRNSKNIFFPLQDLIEKPATKEAPSNLYAVGRYIFNNEILKFLSKEKADSSGEIQLTGAISNFARSSKKLNGLLVDGDVYDCGNKTGHLIANLAFSIKNKKTKKEVLKYLNR